jgi:hypothetical protein
VCARIELSGSPLQAGPSRRPVRTHLVGRRRRNLVATWLEPWDDLIPGPGSRCDHLPPPRMLAPVDALAPPTVPIWHGGHPLQATVGGRSSSRGDMCDPPLPVAVSRSGGCADPGHRWDSRTRLPLASFRIFSDRRRSAAAILRIRCESAFC